MADAVRAEKIECGTAYSRFESKSLAASLWNQDDIRALNRTQQAQIAQLPKEFVSPSNAAGVIARDASGLTSPKDQALVNQGVLPAADSLLASLQEAEKQELIAQAPAVRQHQRTGQDIADHAHELGEKHPKMWATEHGRHGEIRKCNLFVDKVYRGEGVPLPWDNAHIPTVHTMKDKLLKSDAWQTAYKTGQNFEAYNPKAGDLAIWDKTISAPKRLPDGRTVVEHHHLEHSGVIGGNGEIVYAGSLYGYAESDFEGMSHAVAWGPPSVIFRSKHVK